MSKNIIEIKQNDSISKERFSKRKIIPERILIGSKVLCGAKKNAFILLLIFLILGLFISSAYFLLSKNSKKSNLVNDSSLSLGELRNEKGKAARQLLPTPKIITPSDEEGSSSGNINEGDSSNRFTPKIPTSFDEEGSSIGTINVGDSFNKFTQTIKLVTYYERNVLLITNYLSKKGNGHNNISTDVLYNILNQMKKVTLTVLDAYDSTLDTKGINYLKKYHLVAIDFIDGGFNLAPRYPNFTKALIQYVKEGGALFSNHDQFEDTSIRFVAQEAIEMLKLLGFTHQNSWGVGGSTAYFVQTAVNHPVYGIPIAYTHQAYSRYDESCTTCKVIMKFSPFGPNSYEFLVINRPFKGKTLNIRSGHSSQFTEPEKKLFLSSILWLLYVK